MVKKRAGATSSPKRAGSTGRPQKMMPMVTTKTKARIAFKTYSTYYIAEGDHDMAIDRLHTAIDDSGVDLKDLSQKSGVGLSTLKNWLNNRTMSPRHMTLAAVAGALGKDYALVDRIKPK